MNLRAIEHGMRKHKELLPPYIFTLNKVDKNAILPLIDYWVGDHGPMENLPVWSISYVIKGTATAIVYIDEVNGPKLACVIVPPKEYGYKTQYAYTFQQLVTRRLSERIK